MQPGSRVLAAEKISENKNAARQRRQYMTRRAGAAAHDVSHSWRQWWRINM